MSDKKGEITTPREIARLSGLSERTIQRLASSGNMKGVTLKADGYHNEYRLTDDLLAWIAQRKRQPKGGVPHESNVQKAMRDQIQSISLAMEVLKELKKRIMSGGDRAVIKRLENVLIWAAREGDDCEFPPIGALSHFLSNVPDEEAVWQMTPREAVERVSEARPILRYLCQLSRIATDGVSEMFADTSISIDHAAREQREEDEMKSEARHMLERLGMMADDLPADNEQGGG